MFLTADINPSKMNQCQQKSNNCKFSSLCESLTISIIGRNLYYWPGITIITHKKGGDLNKPQYATQLLKLQDLYTCFFLLYINTTNLKKMYHDFHKILGSTTVFNRKKECFFSSQSAY